MANKRIRNWCFTIHNFTDILVDSIKCRVNKDTKLKQIKHLVFQGETCPTTGRKHLQGHIIFHNPKELKHVKKFLGDNTAHLEPMRGTPEQSLAYCTKDDTCIPNTRFEYGELPVGQGTRTDLQQCIELIEGGAKWREIINKYPQLYVQYRNGLEAIKDELRGVPRTTKTLVEVYFGESGTGKSHDAIVNNPDAYVLRNSNGNVWFDGYDYQDTVIIDEFYGWIPFDKMLQLLDRYALKVDIKGGAKEFNSKRIIITSNKNPRDWYKNISTEHKIALLRRLDKVVYYGRDEKLDVTESCQKEIRILQHLSKNKANIDPWVKNQRKLNNTIGSSTDIEEELRLLDDTSSDDDVDPEKNVDYKMHISSPKGNTIPLDSTETENLCVFSKRDDTSCGTSEDVPEHDRIECSTSYGKVYWKDNLPIYRHDVRANRRAIVKVIDNRNAEPRLNSSLWTWNYVCKHNEYWVN